MELSRPSFDYYNGYYWEDRTTFTYDADGNQITTVDPRGNVPGANPATYTTTVTYDADGRPTATTDPLGRTTTTGYDAASRPTSVTDPAGGVTATVYNKMGWPTSVTAPGAAKTSYLYDSVGNLTKRTDPLTHATTYTYDKAGRVLTQTDPLQRITATTYDAVGNPIKVVKPSGTATAGDSRDGTATHTYDAANRLTATTYSDATAGFTYDYSAAGRLIKAERVQNGSLVVASSAYAYDTAGRETSTVRTGPGGGTTNYSYTDAGRLSGTAWSTGKSAAYSYNSVGELITVSPSGTGDLPAVQYSYDPSGQVSTVTRGGATPTLTASMYDTAGQLTSLIHSMDSTVVAGYDITRDTRGNPTKVITTAGPTATTALYGYDAINRLTSECYPTTGSTCTNTAPKTSYTYDKVDNRKTQAVRTTTGTSTSTQSTVYAYDAADELLTQTVAGATTATNTWTPNGALATTTTPTGTTTFTTDLTDELVSAVLEDGSTVAYTHDTKGNRTSRSVGGAVEAAWAWDDLSTLSVRTGEYDPTGSLTTSWLSDPTSTIGAALAESSDGVSDWLLSDPFSNVTAAASTTGSALSGTRSLNAFGGARGQATGTLADSAIGFAGQYLETATGIYDMRARDYNPTTGRFAATDPLAVPAGTPYFSGYSYAYNNPLMHTDASGLCSFDSGGSYCGKGGNPTIPSVEQIQQAREDAELNCRLVLLQERSYTQMNDLQRWVYDALPFITAGAIVLGLALGAGLSARSLSRSAANGARNFGRFSASDLRAAAQVPDRNGLTQVGRALQKHSSRSGSAFFGSSSGSSTLRNEQGLRILNSIIDDKGGKTEVLANVTNIWDSSGRGVRFSNDGSFMGFLEPRP